MSHSAGNDHFNVGQGLSRRDFLRAAIVGGGIITFGGFTYAALEINSRNSPPRLLWSEEFDAPLDLVSQTNPHGKWRLNDVWQDLDAGYVDFGAGGNSCWMANPNQTINGVAYNPLAVRNSVLRITARRADPAVLPAIEYCPWIGGMLISNTDRDDMTFSYGYYEFRARFPNPGRGMFPAIWFYAAHEKNEPAQAAAEIDLFEVFGNEGGQPWVASLHAAQSQNRGSGQVVIRSESETSAWHTYGLNWQEDRMEFYRDRKLLKTVTGAVVQNYAGCKMSIRMNYSMNATWFGAAQLSDASTPNELYADFDYVRQYDRPF